MKKIILALALLAVATPASAQWQYVGYTQLTVDNTAGGVPFPAGILTSTGHLFPTQAVCSLETAEIRWTVDGTAPTTTIGTVASAGGFLPTINGSQLLSSFRAIRTGGSSGTLSCSFFTGGVIDEPLSASGGGGGSGGGTTFNGVLLDAAGGDAITDTVNNALRVNIVTGAGSGGTAIADDGIFTPAVTNVTPAGGYFDDVTPDSVNEGDAGAVRMSANRNLYSTIRDAAGNERGLNVDANGAIAATVSDGAGALNTIVDSGTLTAVTSITNTVNTIGTIANDVAAAGANRTPTLPGITENAAPTRTDGRNAALSLTTGGAARVMLTNAAGAAQTIASDQTFGTSTYTEATTTGPLVGAVRTDSPVALANTTNEIAPLSVSALGALYTASASDPCSRIAKSYYVVNTTTAATFEIANAVASQFIYVCSVNLVAAGAQAVLIAHDDTDACVSITAGMNGGTTAATGWNFAANGGIALGTGESTVMKAATANHYFCLLTSTTAQLSGTIAYVFAP